MVLPSALEARPVSVEVPIIDLEVNDEVGPEDPTEPLDYTVVGVPPRTREQRRVAGNIPLRVRRPDGVERARAAATVFVRRYEAVVTITRQNGSVDVVTALWKSLGNVVTPEDPSVLQLRRGDTFTITTT